jgi:hypothetical protein
MKRWIPSSFLEGFGDLYAHDPAVKVSRGRILRIVSHAEDVYIWAKVVVTGASSISQVFLQNAAQRRYLKSSATVEFPSWSDRRIEWL